MLRIWPQQASPPPAARRQAEADARPHPPLILSSPSLSNLSHVFFREPANGSRRLSVSICPPPDPRRSIWIRHADMDGRLGAPLCRRLIWASGRPPVLRIRRTTSPPTRFRQTPTASFRHVRQACPQLARRPCASSSRGPPAVSVSPAASSRPSPPPAPGLK